MRLPFFRKNRGRLRPPSAVCFGRHAPRGVARVGGTGILPVLPDKALARAPVPPYSPREAEVFRLADHQEVASAVVSFRNLDVGGRAMKTKLFVAFLVLVGFPAFGLAHPIMDVSPTSHDFGNVQVGTSEMTVVTIQNIGEHPLTVNVIELKAGSSTDFCCSEMPTLPAVLGEFESVDVTIAYTPSAVGYASGVLQIYSNAPYEPFVEVYLSGMGVESEPPPDQQIQDVIDFIEESVDAGTLAGSGPGSSGDGRLNALINMIEAAGDLIEAGDFEQAYDQLEQAYKRCDGLTPPPDFVEGEARETLAAMILDLMALLLNMM